MTTDKITDHRPVLRGQSGPEPGGHSVRVRVGLHAEYYHSIHNSQMDVPGVVESAKHHCADVITDQIFGPARATLMELEREIAEMVRSMSQPMSLDDLTGPVFKKVRALRDFLDLPREF